MEKSDLKSTEPIFKKHQVKYAGVFGSYARGEAKHNSDIDILVRFKAKSPGYFSFIGLRDELSEAIGRPVDLVTENGLSPYLRDRILADLQIVYERRSDKEFIRQF